MAGVGRDSHLWNFFLYNLTADRAETTDLWASQRLLARAMLARFLVWQSSVVASQQAGEIGCADPMPPQAFSPVPHMQNVKARCTAAGGNFLGERGAATAEICAEHTAARHGRAFSFSDTDSQLCWSFKTCDKYDRGSYVYNWSSFTLGTPEWQRDSLRFLH
jgi:hypothetical protein